jgi:undecaprenyl diphosphate synthase
MDQDRVPYHVAIIMDGNGRWAKARKLPRTQGHLEGVKRVEESIATAIRAGIKVLTIYAFSTENWNRPEHEVSMLMHTLLAVLNQKVRKLHESGVCIKFIGRKEGVPDAILKGFEETTRLTCNNTRLTLVVAFNYGGRLEILDAVVKAARDVKENKITLADINEKRFSSYLYTEGLADPDLLIRTSGEQRISNFLLWQLSYAEFYFTEKFWPDFDEDEFYKAIRSYQNRERRFGGLEAK